jgi:hypothetical protein
MTGREGDRQRTLDEYMINNMIRACTWTLNEKCYNYVSDPMDWNTAEAICSSAYGGHLVINKE